MMTTTPAQRRTHRNLTPPQLRAGRLAALAVTGLLALSACSDDDAALAAPADVAPASTAAASTAPAGRTLTLLQKDGDLQFVDTAPLGGEDKPPSMGDLYAFANTLLDPTSKAERGQDHGVCTVTVPGEKAVTVCTDVFALDDGQLMLVTSYPFVSESVTYAVVGGTGAYAGARGTAVYSQGEGENGTWTVTLLP